MKRIAAIVLSALLFFNWYGYQLVADYLQYQSDIQLAAKLDNNNYDESLLIELRIPLNLPYYNDWKNFEPYTGDIAFNGMLYRYVKRKIEHGELVLLCIPDYSKQRIQSARDEFFKLINDLQQTQPDKRTNSGKSLAHKNFFSDYCQEKNNWAIEEVQISRAGYNFAGLYYPSDGNAVIPEQPPEYIAPFIRAIYSQA